MLHSGESGCQKVADTMANVTDEHLGSASAPGEVTVSAMDFSGDGLQSMDLFLKSELLRGVFYFQDCGIATY